MVNTNGTFDYERSLSDGPGSRNTETIQDGIPADDGMQSLRQKLHEVRLLAISTEEKAKRMHHLMMTQYAEHVLDHTDSVTGVALPVTTHLRSKEETDDGWEIITNGSNLYNLRPGDTDATISPLPRRPRDMDDDAQEEEEGPALGCRHYKRNVKIQCFDCEQWYNCRHCHDAATDLPFPHALNRKKTKNMLCMLCKTPQPASERCIKCDEYAAWYYCSKCKLWDNDTTKCIYHCDDCGLCRIGQGLGKDFVHCRRCNVCISIATSNSHPCIERATDSDCPLCLNYLFESQTPVVSLPCGHYMHGECYRDLMAVTYKCPVCNKSAVNMELQWRKLDDEIHAQPMPEDDHDLHNLLPHIQDDGHHPELETGSTARHGTRSVWIGCNDCGARSSAAFHWLGLKCQVCGGYNTNQMAPPIGRETDAERLFRQQASHRQHDFSGNYVLHDVGIGREDDLAVDEQSTRVDSAIDASSPPNSPPRPGLFVRRASDAEEPSRRYFVQAPEQRRSSSFTAPRFATPSMPTLPGLPSLPRMPDLSSIRDLQLPSLPQLPTMSSIELSRFSPYEMAAVLSRSLSPMRYARDGSASAGQVPQRRGSGIAYWRNSAPPDAYRHRAAPSTSSTEGEDGHGRPGSSGHALPLRLEENSRRTRDAAQGQDDEDIFAELIGHP